MYYIPEAGGPATPFDPSPVGSAPGRAGCWAPLCPFFFFEAYLDGTMRTRVCEAGEGGRVIICTHLGTLFNGLAGCTKMPPVHFWICPPRRETKLTVGSKGSSGVRPVFVAAGTHHVHCPPFFGPIVVQFSPTLEASTLPPPAPPLPPRSFCCGDLCQRPLLDGFV